MHTRAKTAYKHTRAHYEKKRKSTTTQHVCLQLQFNAIDPKNEFRINSTANKTASGQPRPLPQCGKHIAQISPNQKVRSLWKQPCLAIAKRATNKHKKKGFLPGTIISISFSFSPYISMCTLYVSGLRMLQWCERIWWSLQPTVKFAQLLNICVCICVMFGIEVLLW